MRIILCNEDNVFFPSPDLISCKYSNCHNRKKMLSNLLLCKSIFGFSENCDVHFVGDLKNQGRGEVINHFHGKKGETEKSLRGGLWGTIFPLSLRKVSAIKIFVSWQARKIIKYKTELFQCSHREAVMWQLWMFMPEKTVYSSSKHLLSICCVLSILVPWTHNLVRNMRTNTGNHVGNKRST